LAAKIGLLQAAQFGSETGSLQAAYSAAKTISLQAHNFSSEC